MWGITAVEVYERAVCACGESKETYVLYLQLETKSLLRAPQVHMIVALNVSVSLHVVLYVYALLLSCCNIDCYISMLL